MEENKKFYEKKWFTWVALFTITPVGIICLWRYKHYKTIPAIIFTLIFGIVFLSVISGKDKPMETKTITKIDNQVVVNTTIPTVKPTVILLPTSTLKPTIPPEYKSALNKANTYANTMHMSKMGVYNQLTSEYGEKFSKDAAQYAIDNIQTDWNAHALAKAKNYQSSMSMSPAAIRNQLISEHGEKFTQEQADYAIKHLND
jgi:hypothetical protein